jgi:hypothetical protein
VAAETTPDELAAAGQITLQTLTVWEAVQDCEDDEDDWELEAAELDVSLAVELSSSRLCD